MARPLRIEYEGAYYHLLSRGNQQQAVFLSDRDRRTLLESLLKMGLIYFSYRTMFIEILFGQVLFCAWRIIPRDMPVYALWQSGRFSNTEIGSQIGLTISSISRQVGIFREMLDTDKKVREDYTKFRAIIKV